MDYNKFWLSRRTIRRYDVTRHVGDSMLEDMLLQASHAPTTGNMQWYSVIVTRDEEGKKALAPAHFGQPQVTGCDVVLTFCADLNRFSRWCEERDADPCYDNFQSLMAAFLDTALLAQQFNTIAEMNGLGVCMLGTTTYNAPEIAAVLDLPALVVPLITLTVGYPAEEPDDCGRLPVEAFIHHGRYHYYTREDIDRLYAVKEARDDSRRFVAENGKSTLAQVFTDVRYPRANNEIFSKKFLDYLKKSGF